MGVGGVKRGLEGEGRIGCKSYQCEHPQYDC